MKQKQEVKQKTGTGARAVNKAETIKEAGTGSLTETIKGQEKEIKQKQGMKQGPQMKEDQEWKRNRKISRNRKRHT
jgi:hypothetical protein